MKTMAFVNPRFLEEMGRGVLARLVARFEPEFAGLGLTVPGVALEDEAFYRQVATLAVATTREGGAERFVEALHGIEGMASDEGRERLMGAVRGGTGAGRADARGDGRGLCGAGVAGAAGVVRGAAGGSADRGVEFVRVLWEHEAGGSEGDVHAAGCGDVAADAGGYG